MNPMSGTSATTASVLAGVGSIVAMGVAMMASASQVAPIVIGLVAVALGAAALLRRRGRWWMSAVGLCSGLVPLAFATLAWRASLPPNISIEDLFATREMALPVLEKLTGLKFRSSVPITLGVSARATDPAQERLRRDFDQPDFQFPLIYVGLYETDTKAISIMPAAIGDGQRNGVLARGNAQDIARAVVVAELVHALDDQNGMLESEADRLRMSRTDPYRFCIRRAIQEGRSHYFGRMVCGELGIRSFGEFLTGRAPTPLRTDVLSDMLREAAGFIYGSGPRFFDELHAAGRLDLLRKASETPPLWLHHIERTHVYIQDMDAGMDERFREAFAGLSAILGPPDWQPPRDGRLPIGETPRFANMDDCLSEQFTRRYELSVADWFGSAVKASGGGWAIIHVFRFPDVDAAERGYRLGRELWNVNADDSSARLDVLQLECPNADQVEYVRMTYADDAPASEYRCLARSGCFTLEAKFRGAVTEVLAYETACRLLREFLMVLGRPAAEDAASQ